MNILNLLGKRLAIVTAAALMAAGLGLKPTTAQAVPITYIHEGSMSGGSLDGVAIGRAGFVITAMSDTSTVQSCGGTCLFNDHVSASINIFGLGVFDFLTATRTFINSTTVGFSRAGGGGLDLFNGPNNGGLSGYDLASDIGPLGGAGTILQWSSDDIDTSGGILNLNNFQTDAQFTATVSNIPVPATVGFLFLGLAGLGVAGRRRRR